MTRIVISQPMYFPWYGHFEQVKNCDIYVFYDDVQFSRGFFNRVQLKINNKQKWMTLPLKSGSSRKLLNNIYISSSEDWINSHLETFKSFYKKAPFFEMAFSLMHNVIFTHKNEEVLSLLAEKSTIKLAKAFKINNVDFIRSSELGIKGIGTERLLNICKKLNAKKYITGHGARNYMEHELFEKENIEISYIKYSFNEYKQHSGGDFIPFVSGLDCIANCGENSKVVLGGDLVSWKDYIK